MFGRGPAFMAPRGKKSCDLAMTHPLLTKSVSEIKKAHSGVSDLIWVFFNIWYGQPEDGRGHVGMNIQQFPL